MLTENQVQVVRWLLAADIKHTLVAAHVKTDRSNVDNIASGKTWIHLGPVESAPPTLAQLFWPNVDTSPGHGPRGDCWVWTGHRLPGRGYGKLKVDGKQLRAPRVALALSEGRELLPQEHACHGCDYPPCVRVGDGHLFIGSAQDNSDDMVAKGRSPRGERNANAKLTAADVLAIRRRLAAGESQIPLAREYGVRQSRISSIKLGQGWRHVATAAVVLATLLESGCGGGGHRPKPAPAPTPIATPLPHGDHAVPCFSYTYAATAEEYRAIEAHGVVGVMEYVTWPPERVCERLRTTNLKLIRALYYGDATPQTIEPVTQGVVREHRLCPERLLWTYPFDEPIRTGRSRAIVEQAIASVAKALPVPTLIAYGEQNMDSAALYRGLNYRGIEVYARRWLDAETLRERLDRFGSQDLVLIVRAWSDKPCCCSRKFGCDWSDADIAKLIRVTMAEARRRPNVKGILLFTANDGGDVAVQSTEWLALPETRAAIREVCR